MIKSLGEFDGRGGVRLGKGDLSEFKAMGLRGGLWIVEEQGREREREREERAAVRVK